MPVANNKMVWSPFLKRVYQKYPAVYKTADWEKIVKAVNSGNVDEAMAIAKSHEDSHKSHRAQNVIARRIRIQRVALINVQKSHIVRLKAAFEIAGNAIGNRMVHLPNTVSSIAPMRDTTRTVIVELRRAVNTIMTDLIWQSIILGVKNMGEAIKPIIRDNRKKFLTESTEIDLLEERLTMGMSKKLANKTDGTVDIGSEKWQNILDGIYAEIVKSNVNGMTLSERIWDLTNRAEQDIKRILSSDIAKGAASREIADKIQKYIFTKGIDEDFQSGPGIYRSPLKNAMRLARTETNRAYTQATAAWADNKPWVKGIRVTLSPAHDVEDDCDDIVDNQPDDGYDPDTFADVVPVHPHCMCFGTYVIDENYLTGNAPSADDGEVQGDGE